MAGRAPHNATPLFTHPPSLSLARPGRTWSATPAGRAPGWPRRSLKLGCCPSSTPRPPRAGRWVLRGAGEGAVLCSAVPLRLVASLPLLLYTSVIVCPHGPYSPASARTPVPRLPVCLAAMVGRVATAAAHRCTCYGEAGGRGSWPAAGALRVALHGRVCAALSALCCAAHAVRCPGSALCVALHGRWVLDCALRAGDAGVFSMSQRVGTVRIANQPGLSSTALLLNILMLRLLSRLVVKEMLAMAERGWGGQDERFKK